MRAFLWSLAAASVATGAMAQTPSMPNAAFEAALNGGGFVMITVENASNGRDWTGCVAAPHLIGALTLENDLPKTQEGFNRARDLAIAARDHRFAFKKPGALRNIPRHTDAQWDDARSKVRNRSKDEILASSGLSFDRTPVGAAAAACAIIEKGLLARQNDRTATVTAEEAPMGPQAAA